MERISLQADRKAIIAEHVHRYRLSSMLASGAVLDISCGIGYGSKIIKENNAVSSYLGIDISPSEIEYAKENFLSPEIEFSVGDICALDFPGQTFDSIVCLETLEHLENPVSAVKELSRVLKEEGLLIGSVPQEAYEFRCESTYGPNVYHLHKFSKEALKSLLKTNFKSIEIVTVGVTLGTLVEGPSKNTTATDFQDLEGSFLFIASKKEIDIQRRIEQIKGLFLPALSMLEYDEELVVPLRKTIQDQETIIQNRNSLILKTESLVKDKEKAITSIEQLVREKDNLIEKQNALLKDREECISSMDKMIKERDEAIQHIEGLLEKRWEIIQEYEVALQTLRGAIK